MGTRREGAAPVHYLRGNETVWTPPQVICFDTETRQRRTPAGELHTMRLWAARLDSRRVTGNAWTGSDTAWGRTAGELAEQLTAWCLGQRTVWSYAHNLSFDLTVARIPTEMTALGWTVTDHAVGSDSPWLRMKKGGTVLTLADSWGWLRTALENIGSDVGIRKPPLPDEDDSEAAWLQRCQADTDILAEAMVTVMDWWDANALGRWSLTGSHSGWNVMRHMMPRKKITIMPDPEQVEADRLAIYGGRRECFAWGEPPGGPFTEYDFSRAYTVIAAELPLPIRRQGEFTHLDINHPWVDHPRWGMIAHVELETPEPRWPCRANGRVWYPVGRFTTVLAAPEILEARRLGCLRAIGRGWLHQLGTPLQNWAKWCLDTASDTNPDTAPVVRRVVKHWGRAVPGKFAAHGWSKEDYGQAISDKWSYLPVYDHASQSHGSVIELCGKRWKCLQTPAGDNTYPAVLAFIESHTRLRLTRVIESAGPGAVVCCDTDGLIMARPADPAALGQAAGTWPLTLRAKETWRRLEIAGPGHLVRDGARKYQGVPGSAVKLPDGRLTALVWPRLAWQMTNGQPDGYMRPAATYTIGACHAAGWVLADGSVAAVEVAPGAGGHQEVQPWHRTAWHGQGLTLGPVQSRQLAALNGG